MQDFEQVLQMQQIAPPLIREVEEFRLRHAVSPAASVRIFRPVIPYYGREILETALAALLQGENILLSGSKATGKNVLAENLAWILNRPQYDISFHVNTDSAALIGTDTFRNQQVVFRPGPVYECAVQGGFGILDEINMAKNEAAAVLHAVLDFRRIIDVPGYERIELHDAARFIGTMNYGYAGTRDLNEALVSRFLVIDMPSMTEAVLAQILKEYFPDLNAEGCRAFNGLFMDLQLKAGNSEISTKPVDLRGMIAAIRMMHVGIAPARALQMGIVNKSFDVFEKDIVRDIVDLWIPSDWKAENVFG